MVSPEILRLPTADLFEHLRTLRHFARLEHRPATVGAIIDVSTELSDRALRLGTGATFDGEWFHLAHLGGDSDCPLAVPPSDFDTLFALLTGALPR